MKTHYFTLGQTCIHRFNGHILDKDCLIKITAENPSAVMKEHFQYQWAFEYTQAPNKYEREFYPRGIYDLNKNIWEK